MGGRRPAAWEQLSHPLGPVSVAAFCTLVYSQKEFCKKLPRTTLGKKNLSDFVFFVFLFFTHESPSTATRKTRKHRRGDFVRRAPQPQGLTLSAVLARRSRRAPRPRRPAGAGEAQTSLMPRFLHTATSSGCLLLST